MVIVSRGARPGPARRLVPVLVAAALLLAACDGDPVTVPTEQTPFLYLVLGEPSINQHAPFDGPRIRQHAMLLGLGSPAENARYLTAQSFVMLEQGTLSRFGWEHTGIPWDEVGSFPGVSFRDPNYQLAPQAADGRGAAELRPGTTYSLRITTPLGTIIGETSTPGPIQGRIIESEPTDLVAWAPVAGAMGYRVVAGDMYLVSDTAFRLPPDLDDDLAVWVEALDPNVWSYLTDDALPRAGIEGGNGVFGAITRDSVR